MYTTIRLRTTSLATTIFHLEIGGDASDTPDEEAFVLNEVISTLKDALKTAATKAAVKKARTDKTIKNSRKKLLISQSR